MQINCTSFPQLGSGLGIKILRNDSCISDERHSYAIIIFSRVATRFCLKISNIVHNSLSVRMTKSSHSLYLFPHLKVYHLEQALEHRTKYHRMVGGMVGQNCGKKYSDRLMTVLKIEHLKAQKRKCCERPVKIYTNAVHRPETQTL